MGTIKKGSVVSRKSYNNDIIFYVDDINNKRSAENLAILKGITIRIMADSPVDDLNVCDKRAIKDLDIYDNKFEINDKLYGRTNVRYGKILHLDGDKRYSEKTETYYRKHKLNYVVKHVAEIKQAQVIKDLLRKYNPDIVVFTGHDAIIKKNKGVNDLNNYRNSKYFVKAVIEARKWNSNCNELVIFAGACQSYYEALISVGANFASSPARILIDFIDPLVVAEEVATTTKDKIITMSDLEHKIRNGRMAVSGIGATGKKIVI